MLTAATGDGRPVPDACLAPLPRVVAIGGGTGLPNVLRGLRSVLFSGVHEQAGGEHLVAVVTTSDDGGSSGRLRTQFNVIPPGDIRNCLAALSNRDSEMASVFQYRFEAGDGLTGHAIGNLVLTALADVTHDFVTAVDIAARLLGARGIVLPATAEGITLEAEFADGRVLRGETAIAAAGGAIRRIRLVPPRPTCLPRVADAIARADVIIAGPGSLYTSILPPLLVDAVAGAIDASPATAVLIANLMTEPGETDRYGLLDHLVAIERHLGRQLFDCVIYNTRPVPAPVAAAYRARGAFPIVPSRGELEELARRGVRAVGMPLLLVQPAGKIRHHPGRVAAALAALRRRTPEASRDAEAARDARGGGF
ncbi:MAG TPA: gluconeogenesis factor YvcK family protein [Vicinamibacterales bacterium]|nr:gluconeogenesis factor YvcK family protein [Vicinamibacterales bacterium]